jgi:hypothetical protein
MLKNEFIKNALWCKLHGCVERKHYPNNNSDLVRFGSAGLSIVLYSKVPKEFEIYEVNQNFCLESLTEEDTNNLIIGMNVTKI